MWKKLTLTGKILIVAFFIFTTISIYNNHKNYTISETYLYHSGKIKTVPAFEFTNTGQFIVHKKNWFVGSTLSNVPAHTKIKYKEDDRLIFIYPERENANVAVFAIDVACLPHGWKVVATQ